MPYLNQNPLSETRWEGRVESVKGIRNQSSDIVDALVEVSEESNDAKIKSEAMSLASEMQNFELLLSMVIWYDVLFAINAVWGNVWISF